MKKYIFIVSLLCLLAACTGKRQGEAAVEVAALPAVEDVVMYQVNPRVFAREVIQGGGTSLRFHSGIGNQRGVVYADQ